MNEDQLTDAAEREIDLYRNEVTRITGLLNEAREQRNALTDAVRNLAREYQQAGELETARRLRELVQP